jgi:hypothetical protein
MLPPADNDLFALFYLVEKTGEVSFGFVDRDYHNYLYRLSLN